MNKEEKKAIEELIYKALEMLEKFIKEHKLYNIRQADNLEENIEIALNYIDKLEKENKELRDFIQNNGMLYRY